MARVETPSKRAMRSRTAVALRWRRAFAAVLIAARIAASDLPIASAASAQAAAWQTISRNQFHARTMRLQGLIAACAASAAACDGNDVGSDVQVEGVVNGSASNRGFEEHWQWLRSSLDKAKSAQRDVRATLMSAASAQISDLARESEAAPDPQEAKAFQRARNRADEVLSQAEFQRASGPTWWERAKAWMADWIKRLFLGVAQVGVAAPWLGTLLEWISFVAAAVGLLFLLLRNITRQRLRVALGDATLQRSAWDRDADDWAVRAEQYAASSEWRDAVHCLYWAAIVSLESRRAWRHNPARTPREYVLLLKPGSAQQQSLNRLTQIFERIWYGVRDADAAVYAEARAMYERLSSGTIDPPFTASALAERGAA